MLLPRLHARSWDDPQIRHQVDLGPGGSTHFAGPARGEDGELRGRCGDNFALDHLRHEPGQFQPGQRRPVLDRRNLVGVRKKIFEVSAPPGRILALPVFAHRSPIKNVFDPAAQPHCGFRLGRPDWPTRAHDHFGIDITDGRRTEHGRRIAANVVSHCAACLVLFQVPRCALM
jgi:hypothetical protein